MANIIGSHNKLEMEYIVWIDIFYLFGSSFVFIHENNILEMIDFSYKRNSYLDPLVLMQWSIFVNTWHTPNNVMLEKLILYYLGANHTLLSSKFIETRYDNWVFKKKNGFNKKI